MMKSGAAEVLRAETCGGSDAPLGATPVISLRDHGLMDRAELQVTGDYTQQTLSAMYNAVTGAVVTGGVAAVEAVAGRVSRLMETARVSGGPRAEQALTPTVLAMIGRSLIEWGESLHMLKYRRTAGGVEFYLCPAQHQWTVLGGTDPEAWIVDGTLTGAQTVVTTSAPRAAWLHVIRDADPDRPERGVSPLQRAAVSSQLVRLAEDALVTEMHQPTKALIPLPQGAGIDTGTLRSDIQNKSYAIAFPTTTSAGFGAGRGSAPLTDWKPQRLKPMPEEALVNLADKATARVVAALGAHPAIMGGGGGNGSVDREAGRQMRKMIMQPIARLIEENAWRVFGERITISWPSSVEAMGIKAKAADALVKMGVDPQAALKIARVTNANVKMAPKPEPPPPPKPPPKPGEVD